MDKIKLDLKMERGRKYRQQAKTALIPVKNLETNSQTLVKPAWIKVRTSANLQKIAEIKQSMRRHNLSSVCEEASCPNLYECFNHGTATFMILGSICTRRCPFCDVAHGKPLPPDSLEPQKLAETVLDMNLRYVVITSVNRDDLNDRGVEHFARCIQAIRKHSLHTKIEILVPDFINRIDLALDTLASNLPDVFNHNLENVPRLYKTIRPRANYHGSLALLKKFHQRFPHIPTKSGLMLGLGETNIEILQVMEDLRSHDVTMLTLGQYLQPSPYHLPVARYVHPDEFASLKEQALSMGFTSVASSPLVRSSYHADLQFTESN